MAIAMPSSAEKIPLIGLHLNTETFLEVVLHSDSDDREETLSRLLSNAVRQSKNSLCTVDTETPEGQLTSKYDAPARKRREISSETRLGTPAVHEDGQV